MAASRSSQPRHAYVHEATIAFRADVDPRAVGAAVTVALCGHWEHEGPCRWPHNNEITGDRFRTLFACEAGDEPEVRAKVVGALRGATEWRVVSDRARDVAEHEQQLAADLMLVPRRE